jgi:hypothetical protein
MGRALEGPLPESGKLEGPNYVIWSIKMKNVLFLQDLWKQVDPNPVLPPEAPAPPAGQVVVPPTPPTAAELVAIAKGKRIALSQLALSVKDDLITMVNSFTDPHDAWNHLKAMY